MSEPMFKSSLSMEQIEKNFENVDFFSGIMDGSQEALAYTRGQAAAETFARKSSLPVVDVADVRASLCLNQT